MFAEGVKLNNRLENPLIQRYISKKLTQNDELYEVVKVLEKKLECQTRTLHNLANEYVQLGHQSLEYGSVGEQEVKYGEKTISALNSIAVKSAIANYNKALELWDECVEAIIGKARVYYEYGEMEVAEDLFFKALALDKTGFEANYYIGCICFEKDQIELSLKSLKRALKADKKSIKCHEKLVEVYDELGFDDLADNHREIIRKLKT